MNFEPQEKGDDFNSVFDLNKSGFYSNIKNNVLPVVFISLGVLSLKERTLFYFLSFSLPQFFYAFSYMFGVNASIISDKKTYAYSMFHLFVMMQCGLIVFYVWLSTKTGINPPSPSESDSDHDLFALLNLKLDMLKIKYNSILINLKLHKIFSKRILFGKKDYFFVNLGAEEAKEGKEWKSEGSSSLNDASTAVDNSYSILREDDELSSLK